MSENGNGQGNGKPDDLHPPNTGQGKKQVLHPALQANVWKPGQSGNPKGRPKRKSISEAIYEVLMRELPPDVVKKFPHLRDKLTIEVVAEVAVQQAIKGDFQFFKEVIERVDGKVPELFAVSLKESYERRLVLDLLADDKSRSAALLLEQRIGSSKAVTDVSGGNGEVGQPGQVEDLPSSGDAQPGAR